MIEDIGFGSIVIIFISLVISMTIHEAMHAFTGHWLGDDTAYRQGRISLNPFRHIDPFATILLPMITLVLFHLPFLAAKPVPFNPNRVKFDEFGAALVGVAGPLTNLLLAVASAGLYKLFLNFSFGTPGLLHALGIFTAVNIGLFVFNMIPIPPLDGSRLLYAFAPEPVQSFMASIEAFGIMIIFSLIILVPAFGVLIAHIDNSLVNLFLY